ncbi:MAG: hypothetical protein M1836_003822 [Candelina mexicana]|nr:MAG: hypothetical protein M1836_003822 [Candelina mexicana]KAI9766220.1 MAG: hypothetical protein M1835_007223 [Candelina submexicana]
MPDVKRTIKLVTEQNIIDKPSAMEGFPMRRWNIQVFLLNEHGEEIPASIFDKTTYKLHPSFEKRAIQSFKHPPFRIEEEGWGEFDIEVVFTAMDKGGDHSIQHDLNFATNRYEAKHTITFKNPKPGLMAALKESGPTPGDENGLKSKRSGKHDDEASKKKKRGDKNIDMEKLADGLQKLGEDDLLQVVQIIHDNKTQETYTKNDVDQGEFHVDLYTLPDSVVKMLWDFVTEKNVV